jgi:FkbM family methyltransferase
VAVVNAPTDGYLNRSMSSGPPDQRWKPTRDAAILGGMDNHRKQRRPPSEMETTTRRAEDRFGLMPGGLTSVAAVFAYRQFAKQWRQLPNFRGKVRLATAMRRILALENHHMTETVTLRDPVRWRATLDLHSWHEFLAFVDGGYEGDTIRFLARCYDQRHGCFIDIGANIGLISLPFALFVNAPVYCIEAVASNCARLRHNIDLNRLQHLITVIDRGLGERDKIVDIQVEGNLKEGEGTGTANILPAHSDYVCERIPLTITTLDALRDAGTIPDRCSLIKMDVDGYELFVLQGSTKMLSSARPTIFGEFAAHCLSWHGHTHDDVLRLARQCDYEVYAKVAWRWQFVPAAQHSVEQDLLLVPKEKISTLSWCISDAR